MAKSNVFLLSILLIASLFYVSHTLTLFGIPIDAVYIRGTLYCSLTGDTICGAENSTITQAFTNQYGVFVLVFNILDTSLFNPSACSIVAYLPTGTCLIYFPDGALRASLNFVNITFSSLRFIANYAVTAFLTEEGQMPGGPISNGTYV
ncbi:hypothetical protein Bca52824_015515 [Brassica carinata]|uniref:Uncharacterized protein n=1 Tax=Brassica carinata TaxID=52824 RepID=A0A8X8B5R3_BRACI|nr:hypothetical protein Bca52824_015515 [Brassica carinata]